MQPLSPDADLDARLRTDGYAVVPFLDSDEVARLWALYRVADPQVSEPFYNSIWSRNIAYRQQVNEGVGGIFARSMSRLFPRYTPFAAGYLVKQCDPNSRVGMHQDWTYLDERAHVSVMVWAPLTDVGPADGRLLVIPGSHRLADDVRAAGREEASWRFSGHAEFLFENYGVELDVRVGSAVLYDAALFHGSRANAGRAPRVAAGSANAPREASLLHYFGDDPDDIAVYDVPRDFYWRTVIPGERPAESASVVRSGTIRARRDRPTREQLAAMCDALRDARR